MNKVTELKIKTNSSLIREVIVSVLAKYDRCILTQSLVCEWFYQTVYKTVSIRSLYRSDDAFDEFDKSLIYTDDHYLAPRLLIRAMIQNERDIIFDDREFFKIFKLSCETVRVTKKQNSDVRYKCVNDDIIVPELTIDKYDKYSTWWDEYDDEYDEFPLKHKIPKFYTKYERSKLKKY